MRYEILDPAQWESVIGPSFASRQLPLPDPKFAFVVVAIEEKPVHDRLAGFLVCQLQIHAEPLVAYQPDCIRGMVRHMESILTERFGGWTYYCFDGGNRRIGQIAETLGMTNFPGYTYVKSNQTDPALLLPQNSALSVESPRPSSIPDPIGAWIPDVSALE